MQHWRCIKARYQPSLRTAPSATNSQSMPLFTVTLRTCPVTTSQRHSYQEENLSYSQRGDQHVPYNAEWFIVAFVYYSMCSSMFVCCSFLTAGLHVSRCGVAEWTRDPGLFVTRPRSPAKPNDCVWFQSCPLNMSTSWFSVHVAKLTFSSMLKGSFIQKWRFCHHLPHVVPNLYEFLSAVENKIR